VSRRKQILLALLSSLISSLWAVRAEAAKVVIVRPVGTTPELNETLSRLQGEVLSLGLELAIVERPVTPSASATDSQDWQAWMAGLASERAADAILDVSGDAARAAVDIWVFEGQPRRFEVSRVVMEPDVENPTARLAIRAVEVLRSSLVAIDLAAKGQRPEPAAREPPAAVARDLPRAAEEPTGHVDLQAGAALLASLDGVGPAVMPVVRIGWSARSWLVLQGAVAGLGSRPTVTAAAGSARVAQQHALVGGCICGDSARALQPTVGLSAGVLRTAIDGQADVPANAHFVERWSFLLEASVGARLRLPGRYHLTLAAHLQMAAPYVAIHFVDTLVATSGRPNLGLSLTVGAWL
jgi:hypothetical protein